MQNSEPGGDPAREGKAGDANRAASERHPLNVALLLNDVAALASDMFPKSIRVEKVVSRDLWPVTGNLTQMGEVLFTFCLNARDAMPAGGTLTLRASNFDPNRPDAVAVPAEVRGPCVLLEIADTGSGVEPEVIEQIALRRVATAPAGKGRALGLSTVVEIVKSHGGVLHIEAAPLRGTTFQVYLPAKFEAV